MDSNALRGGEVQSLLRGQGPIPARYDWPAFALHSIAGQAGTKVPQDMGPVSRFGNL